MESYESTTRRMPGEQPGLCALVQDTLPFYMDGDISPESRAFITTHLDGCLACSQFLAGARSAQSHLRRETSARSRSVADDWRAHDAVSRGQRQLFVRAIAAVGVALLLGVIVFGLGFGRVRESVPAYAPNMNGPAMATPAPFQGGPDQVPTPVPPPQP